MTLYSRVRRGLTVVCFDGKTTLDKIHLNYIDSFKIGTKKGK